MSENEEELWDLGFEKSGPDHYTSRNNAWTVGRLAGLRLWVVRKNGEIKTTAGTKAKAFLWANTMYTKEMTKGA